MASPFPPYPVTPYPPLLVNAALTGGVLTPERAPNLPLTAEQIVADAEQAVAAGAAIVHIHVRDADGRPEWRKEAYAEVVAGVRERCPGVLVCVTTTGRAGIDFAQRTNVLKLGGDVRPDMASLALGSMNFRHRASVTEVDEVERLAAAIADAGVLPELEVFDLGFAAMARRLHDRGLIPERPYANLILGSVNTAPADARSLIALVDALPLGTTWAAGGIGAFQRVANALAVAIGGHVRVGLEDNPDLPGGDPATNAELVAAAVELGRGLSREAMSPEEARELVIG